MKILIVLALISLCAAYVDFDISVTANVTQAYSSYYDNSKGSCEITVKWTQTSMTLEGTITCTGLTGNVTDVHVHDVTKSYSVTYNIGSPLTDIAITVGADPTAPISYKAVLTKTDSIDAICNDQTYWNVHTTYDNAGEVRANMVNMRAICNIDKYAADGSITVYGADPTTGILVPDFCGTTWGYAVKGSGNCQLQICWDQVAATLTFSGVCYSFTSDVYGIEVYFPDDSSYFLYLSYSRFPTDCPFSFRYASIDILDIAKIQSKRAFITINSYDGTEQVQIDLTSASDYPSSLAKCVPFVKGLPEKALTCYSGTNDYNTEYELSSTDYLCSIYDYAGTETLSYNFWSSCYVCECDADLETELPAGASVCCDEDKCNKGDANDLYCVLFGAGSALSGGLMVALFAALISIWFN